MIRVALRGLAGRKLRATLTAFAIVLGVAMVSGTYVLTDTIQKAFDAIFTESYRGTNAVITARTAFESETEGGAEFTTATLPESLLARVREVPSVEAALGGVAGETTLIDRDGDAIVSGGAPNLGFSVDPSQPQFNSLTLERGRWPGRGREVAIDTATAKKREFTVGDSIRVAARGPVQAFEITGLVKFGAVSSIGGATLSAFELRTAQQLFGKEGQLDQIRVAAKDGVSDDELAADLRRALPKTTRVRSGAGQARAEAEGTSEFIGFLQKFLLAFGGIALFVGSFVIANTLSITIAQRTREFATVRTLGGSRQQVLVTVVLEALVIGVVASVVGLFLGLALAKGLNEVFVAAGIELPSVGLVFAPRTIVVSLLVGILVTLLASLRPALRATRVPPIAAVREGATLPPTRYASWRAAGAVALAGVGTALLAFGLFRDGLDTVALLAALGIGALLVFVGVALFASRLVRPLARAVSPLARWSTVALSILFYPVTLSFWLARYGLFERGAGAFRRVGALVLGVLLLPLVLPVALLMWLLRALRLFQPEWPAEFPGVIPDRSATQLARDNAQRNPDRTAATAAALMIGLALVTLVALLGAGIRSTFESSVEELFVADYAITAQNNFSGLPTNVADAAREVPGVDVVAGIRTGQAQLFGDTEFISAVDAGTARAIDLEWEKGSDAVIAGLGPDGAFVEDAYAEKHDLDVGSPVRLLSPSGNVLTLRVEGVFDPPTGGSPFGPVTFSSALFDANYSQPTNQFTFVNVRGDVTEANTQALEHALQRFPNAKVADRAEFTENQISGLSAILNILYVLLALSVIVSLFGIVNTLVLTVFERTRELGMLRAIGMTRRQVRRMIRHESVVTALIGAALGITVGIALAALLIARVEFIEFALPWLSLLVFALASIVVGILAAIVPARRAARLNVLEALQYE